MANNISVIIRCRNEERWIGHAIQSCADFFESPEIIIIDDNSTDNSRRVISTFDYLNIKVMSIEGDYTPGKALNMGVRQATNETILILSAHCVLTSVNYFDKINVLLSDHVAVWGKQIPIWNGKKVNRRYVWSNFKEEDQINYHSPQENRPFLHNALCFYRKNFLLKNEFDETLCGKEDRYWAIDAINDGNSIYYDSSLSANHHYTENGSTWKGVG